MHTFMLKNVLFDIYSQKRLVHSVILYAAYMSVFIMSAVTAYILTTSTTVSYNTFAVIVLVKFFISHFFNIRRISLTHSVNIHVISKTLLIVTVSAVSIFTLSSYNYLIPAFPISFIIIDALFSWCGLVLFYFVFTEIFAFSRSRYSILAQNNDDSSDRSTTLIVGTDPTAQALCKLLTMSDCSQHQIAGFVDDDIRMIGLKIQGIRVYGPLNEIDSIISTCHAQTVIIACGKDSEPAVAQIKKKTRDLPVEVIVIPSYLEFLMKRKDVKVLEGFPVDSMLINNKKVMFTPTIITQKLDPTKK